MAQPTPIKFSAAEVAALDALADEVGCARATVARVGVRLVLDLRLDELRRRVGDLPAERRGRPRIQSPLETADRLVPSETARENSRDGVSDAEATS